jgi:hypothetical protein
MGNGSVAIVSCPSFVLQRQSKIKEKGEHEQKIVVRQFKTLFSMRRTWYSQGYAYNPQMTIAGVVLRK